MRLVVVVPLRNESANVMPFYDRAKRALDSLAELEEWNLRG